MWTLTARWCTGVALLATAASSCGKAATGGADAGAAQDRPQDLSGDGGSDASDATAGGDGLAGSGDGGAPSPPIAPTFFGKHSHFASSAWPTIDFGAMAFGPGVHWDTVEKARGTYDFGEVDGWIADAKAHGQDLTWMYAVGTPPWAGGGTAGGDPPSDLEAMAPCQAPLSGVTTTDCMFKEFLTATLEHVCTGTAPDKSCAFKSWELHNEVNGTDDNWSGTYAQLVQMDADAVAIIKGQCASCVVTTSNVAGGGVGYHAKGKTSAHFDDFLDAYLAEWVKQGRPMPDVVAWHPYSSRNDIAPAPFPETFVGSGCPSPTPNNWCDFTIVDQMNKVRAIADARGMAGRPIWATEGGYGKNSQLVAATAAEQSARRAAYVARWLVLLASGGVERAYWYAWDEQCWGTELGTGMAEPACDGAVTPAGLTSIGRADQQLYDWLVGRSFEAPCKASGASSTVWSCDLGGAEGYRARIVWDTAGPSSYDVPAPYTARWRDLDGTPHAPLMSPLAIGPEPILVENR